MKNIACNSLILVLILCLNFTQSLAQYYQDATLNLPNFGSQFSSMDVRAADLDDDSDLDIILANEFQANTILINDGNGLFTNSSSGSLPQEIHDSEDIAIADFDNDGDLDLVFCSEDDITLGNTNVHEYYLNDGTGVFTKAAYQLPDSKANAVITTYLNDDTWPDLIFGNDGQNTLLINDQAGGFIEETALRLPTVSDVTQDLALWDIDGDGDQDIFVGNEDENRLLINDGHGVFADESTTRLPQGVNMETRKVIFGDVDMDGDADLYLCNVAFIPGKDQQNRLYINNGSGFFTDQTTSRLPTELDFSLDAVFLDIDLDNDRDLIVCDIGILNNAIGTAPLDAYLNDGTGSFTKANSEIFGKDYPIKGLGVFKADYNEDGKMDIYVCDRRDNNSITKDLLLFGGVATTTDELPETREAIALIPNPSDATFTIVFREMEIPSPIFGLYDNAGKLVTIPTIKSRKGNNRFDLDCSAADLPEGSTGC